MYRYRLRPGYGSKKLLIELLPARADEVFFGHLRTVLEQINAKPVKTLDLWMCDQVLIDYDSDLGQFELSCDVWDYVFITAEGNQTAILQIEQLLRQSDRFQREEVDDNDYQLPASGNLNVQPSQEIDP